MEWDPGRPTAFGAAPVRGTRVRGARGSHRPGRIACVVKFEVREEEEKGRGRYVGEGNYGETGEKRQNGKDHCKGKARHWLLLPLLLDRGSFGLVGTVP